MAKKPKEPKVKVGDRIGKLVVVEKVDMPIRRKSKDENGNAIEIDTGKTKIGWYCKCDCGGKITLPETTLLTERSTLRSCDNCSPIENPEYIPKDMTYEDNQKWRELYEYVKKNILNYDDSDKLSNATIMRLKGLTKGKHFAGKKTVNNANYSYETVLNTFKFCSPNIQKILKSNCFNGEQHIINYVSKIIENNINDVNTRMKNIKKSKEQVDNLIINVANDNGVKYQRKTEEMTNELLEDLW